MLTFSVLNYHKPVLCWLSAEWCDAKIRKTFYNIIQYGIWVKLPLDQKVATYWKGEDEKQICFINLSLRKVWQSRCADSWTTPQICLSEKLWGRCHKTSNADISCQAVIRANNDRNETRLAMVMDLRVRSWSNGRAFGVKNLTSAKLKRARYSTSKTF